MLIKHKITNVIDGEGCTITNNLYTTRESGLDPCNCLSCIYLDFFLMTFIYMLDVRCDLINALGLDTLIVQILSLALHKQSVTASTLKSKLFLFGKVINTLQKLVFITCFFFCFVAI